MKQIAKLLGVTLLEVMLVLAVAAMIIVMSIRYYQAANANQQVNGLIQMSQGIAAAADGLAQKDGTFNNSTVKPSNIQALLPNNSFVTPWGTTAIFATADATSYTVTFPDTPRAVCVQASSRLQSSPKYTSVTPPSTCQQNATTDFSYSYDGLK